MTRAFNAAVEFYGGPCDGGTDVLRVPLPQQLDRYLCNGYTRDGRSRYEWQHEHTGHRRPCSHHGIETAPRGCPNRPKAAT